MMKPDFSILVIYFLIVYFRFKTTISSIVGFKYEETKMKPLKQSQQFQRRKSERLTSKQDSVKSMSGKKKQFAEDNLENVDNRTFKSKRRKVETNTAELADQILEATKNDHNMKVSELLKRSLSNMLIPHLEPALLQAIANGNLFISQHLILQGVTTKNLVLHLAAHKGYTDIVDLLLSHCFFRQQIDVLDDDGNTALHLCQSSKAAVHITQLLLDKKANVNITNIAKETALMKAILNHNIKTVLLLINAGADLYIENGSGSTALSMATDLGMDGLLSATTSQGADDQNLVVKAVIARDVGLLTLLLQSFHFDACILDVAIVELFESKLKKKEYPITRCTKNYSMNNAETNSVGVLMPFSNKDFDVLQLLLKAGASIAGDQGDNSPLLVALTAKNKKLVRFLVDNYQPYQLNRYPCTYLAKVLNLAVKDICLFETVCNIHRTCLSFGHDESEPEYIFQSLCEYDDYDPTLFQPILQSAMTHGNATVVSGLLKILKDIYPGYITPVIANAACSGHYQVFQITWEYFSDVEDFESFIISNASKLLSYACTGDSLAIVEHLLQYFHSKSFSCLEDHPLLNAKSSNVCDLLLKYGADLHQAYEADTTVGQKALIQAFESKSFELVTYFVKHGIKISIDNLIYVMAQEDYPENIQKMCIENMPYIAIHANSFVLLKAAVSNSHLTFLEGLLENGANVNEKLLPSHETLLMPYETLMTHLERACWNRNILIVKCLLDYGANPNIFHTRSALSIAIELRNIAIFEMLIERGADIDLKSQRSSDLRCTPLILSILGNNYIMSQYLLERGANPNIISNVYGRCRTALSVAMMSNVGGLEFVKLLIKSGADLNLNPKLMYPLLLSSADKENKDYVDCLLSNGAEINITDSYNKNTALHVAAGAGNVGVVEVLVKRGASLNETNHSGYTALMLAAKSRNFDVFCLLVKAGCDVNVKRKSKTLLSSLLCKAADKWKPDFIIHLLKFGGTTRERDSGLAVHKCVALRRFNVLHALITSGNFAPMLMEEESIFCMFTSDFFQSNYLRTKLFELNIFTGVLSPLCMALLCGDVPIAKYLLSVQFLTVSDLTLLSKHTLLNACLKYTFPSAHLLLKDIKPSLFQLSVAHISELINNGCIRRSKIEKLNIPVPLQRALMFCDQGEQVKSTQFELAGDTSDRFFILSSNHVTFNRMINAYTF